MFKTLLINTLIYCSGYPPSDTAEPKMQETEQWVLEVRKEFPGLLAAKNWVLCDSPGGTQVHKVRRIRRNISYIFRKIS